MDADVARIRSRQRLMRSEVCAGCGMVVGRAREGTGRDAAGRLQAAPKRTREEHLLAAVMSDAATQRLLGQVGRLPDAGAVVAEVRQGTPARGLSAVEVDALAELGIELHEVIGRVEAELGLRRVLRHDDHTGGQRGGRCADPRRRR